MVRSPMDRGRKGFGLLEILLGMIAGIFLLTSMVSIGMRYIESSRAAQAATRLTEVQKAAERYILTYSAELRDLAEASPSRTVSIPVARRSQDDPVPNGPGAGLPSLQGSGFLPETYVDINRFGQSHSVVMRSVGGDERRLEAIAFTTGGRAIEDTAVLGDIAGSVGSTGGFMAMAPEGSTTTAISGVSGGWGSDATLWSVDGAVPTPGHAVASIAVQSGEVRTDYLYRNKVVGDGGPDDVVLEANTMRTNLSLGSNDIRDVRDVLVTGQTTVGGNLTAGDMSVGGDLKIETGDLTAKTTFSRGAFDANGKLYVTNDVYGRTIAVDRRIQTGEAKASLFRERNGSKYQIDPSDRSIFATLAPSRLDTDTLVTSDRLDAKYPTPRKLGDYLSHDLKIVRALGGISSLRSSAVAVCPAGYKRVMCSGARQAGLLDTCSEQNCGYLGALPIDQGELQGCQSVIDGEDATTVAVSIAYCLSNVSGGKANQAPFVETGTPGPPDQEVMSCPEWAPGVYPKCILQIAAPECPDWAPGKYPSCVINKCPVWTTGTFPNCAFAFYQPAANCSVPWSSGTIPHKATVEAFLKSEADYGEECVSEVRRCFNGTLSGSFTRQNCVAKKHVDCFAPWGDRVPHGASVYAWLGKEQPSNVNPSPYCSGQWRTCNEGTLSGQYANRNCRDAWGVIH